MTDGTGKCATSLREISAKVLAVLDALAIEHDRQLYGLPMLNGPMVERMTSVVAEAIREAIAEREADLGGENARLHVANLALAERVAAQSELLSRKAEK